LHWRSNTVDQLLNSHPTILRGNASEIGALAGKRIESKGVDSTINSADVYLQAQSLLAHCDCVAICCGSDYIISIAYPVIQVSASSYLQPQVTATCCAPVALIAVNRSVSSRAYAALAAHVHFAIAGQRAFERAPQFGRFMVAILIE